MLDRLERFRVPIMFVLAFAATAAVWALVDRAHDDARPLTLIATDSTPGGLKIEIAGAVQHPGVYELQPGARVADAIEAAGGLTLDAALGGINLAERVEDEQRIEIPLVGQRATPPASRDPSRDPGDVRGLRVSAAGP